MDWMYLNGSARPNAVALQSNSPAPFDQELYKPPTAPASITQKFSIAQEDPGTWVMNRGPYSEASIPILAGDVSDGWNLATTKHFPSNAVIDIILEISNYTMDSVRGSGALCCHLLILMLLLIILPLTRWATLFICTGINSGCWDLGWVIFPGRRQPTRPHLYSNGTILRIAIRRCCQIRDGLQSGTSLTTLARGYSIATLAGIP